MDIFVLERKLICAVGLPRDRENTARWAVYDLDGKKLSWGYSNGVGGEYGSIPCAMTNAKRAARRILRKNEHSTAKVAREACKKLREGK
jgi:hypothetical protein